MQSNIVGSSANLSCTLPFVLKGNTTSYKCSEKGLWQGSSICGELHYIILKNILWERK